MESPYAWVNRDLISKKQLREFAGPDLWPWLGAVVLEWTLIGVTMWACHRWPYWWCWIAGFFVIGVRQHALGVLAHDGSHRLVTRSLFWNDLLSNYLTAYPLNFTVEGFRTTHLKHHWYLETPDDPSKVSIDHHPSEWTFPMSKGEFGRMVLRDVLGLNQKSSISLLKYLWNTPGVTRKHLVRLAVLHGFFIGLCALTGYIWTYVLLWIVPLFTVAVACYRVRSIAEHSGIGPQEGRYARTSVDSLLATRTTVGCPVLQFIFSPYNISYHIEHHLYPSVPVFRLRSLHQRICQSPAYAGNAHLTRGYRELLKELTGTVVRS